MALDLGKIPAAARGRFVVVGRRFSSEQTLAQANQTLLALDQHAKTLAGFGFALADATRLKDARALLIEAGVGRAVVRGERKQTSLAVLTAKRRAKSARMRAHAILKAVLEQAEELGLSGKGDVIGSVLGQTSFSGDEDEPLARQLDLLRGTLTDKEIDKATRDRGGPDAAKELAAAADELRKKSAAVVPGRGTPAETERLDLIDGIIVSLCRSARRASRVAAVALGQSTLASGFALTYLDVVSGQPGDAEPEPAPAP